MQQIGNATERVDGVPDRKVVTGAFPGGIIPDCLVETVRDLEDSERLEFLCWSNGTAVRNSQIVHGGTCFAPPSPRTPSYFQVTLARDVRPCRPARNCLVPSST